MATDYDAPRRNEADELGEDSLEELKARRAEAQSSSVDVDETDFNENLELPGADLSGRGAHRARPAQAGGRVHLLPVLPRAAPQPAGLHPWRPAVLPGLRSLIPARSGVPQCPAPARRELGTCTSGRTGQVGPRHRHREGAGGKGAHDRRPTQDGARARRAVAASGDPPTDADESGLGRAARALADAVSGLLGNARDADGADQVRGAGPGSCCGPSATSSARSRCCRRGPFRSTATPTPPLRRRPRARTRLACWATCSRRPRPGCPSATRAAAARGLPRRDGGGDRRRARRPRGAGHHRDRRGDRRALGGAVVHAAHAAGPAPGARRGDGADRGRRGRARGRAARALRPAGRGGCAQPRRRLPGQLVGAAVGGRGRGGGAGLAARRRRPARRCAAG